MNGQSDDLEINLTFRPLGEKLDLIEGCLLFRVYLDNFSKKSNIFQRIKSYGSGNQRLKFEGLLNFV